MTEQRVGRRKFLGMAGSAAVMSAVPRAAGRSGRVRKATPKIKVGVIGINHCHIYGQVEAVQRGGGELVSFYAKEADLAAAFAKRFPQATRAASEKAILEDRAIQLVLSAGDSGRARAARHPRDAARQGLHGRQAGHHDARAAGRRAARAGARRGRIYSIMYSERFENRATVKAGELVKAGAIGRVVQTIGLGPHRMNPKTRPAVVLRAARGTAGSCATSARTRPTSSCTSPARPAPRSWPSQVGNVHHPAVPRVRGFRRRDGAR